MTTVVIHQPDFAPYMGFFERLQDADLFIILDDAQFEKGGWQNRDKIKTPYGAKWLTLPIEKKVFGKKINQVKLSASGLDWKQANLNLIAENYRQASAFDVFYPEIENIYKQTGDLLSDYNMNFIRYFLKLLEIDIKIVFSSDLAAEGAATDRLINLLTAVKADLYVTGTGSIDYLEQEKFTESGINLEIRRFQQPVYPQLHGAFIPNLSIIDLVMNCGNSAKDYIRKCNKTK